MTSLAIGSCITLLLFASVVIGAFWGNRRTRRIALSPVALFRAPTSITLQEAFHRFDEASTTREKGDSLVGWKARPEMRMGILVDPNITSLDIQYDYPVQKASYNGLAFLWEDWDGVGLLFVSHQRKNRSASSARSFVEEISRLTRIPFEEAGGEEIAWERLQQAFPRWFPKMIEAYRSTKSYIRFKHIVRFTIGFVFAFLSSILLVMALGPDRFGQVLIVAVPLASVSAVAGMGSLSEYRLSEARRLLLEGVQDVDVDKASVPPWGAVFALIPIVSLGMWLCSINPIYGVVYMFFYPFILMPTLGHWLWAVKPQSA